MSHSLSFQGTPFVERLPSAQNAIDLFDTWASRFPAESGLRTTGQAGLFEDERIQWLQQQMLQAQGTGVQGMRALELGPLEAGHTYMLDRLGAKSVLALESNGIAYLKCLVAKETLGMPSAHFELGDAVRFMEQVTEPFDLCVCSGFLYHQVDPERIIGLLSKTAKHLYLWTITHHPSLFEKCPEMRVRFGPPRMVEKPDGLRYTLHPHHYGEVKDYTNFWGGTQPSSCWMSSEDIQACLRHHGFQLHGVREEPNHFGVALGVYASR